MIKTASNPGEGKRGEPVNPDSQKTGVDAHQQEEAKKNLEALLAQAAATAEQDATPPEHQDEVQKNERNADTPAEVLGAEALGAEGENTPEGITRTIPTIKIKDD